MKQRYAAKLMFQYRIEIEGVSNRRRTVEERIVSIRAPNARSALRQALQNAKTAETSYLNECGNAVHIEFVGVMDLMHLGIECSADDVWYEMKTLVTPLERRRSLVPAEKNLSAFKYERRVKVRR